MARAATPSASVASVGGAALAEWISALQTVEVHIAAVIMSTRAHASQRLNTNAMTAKLAQERAMGWPGAVR